MKKVFKITGIDCANCALKMEDKIKKLENINDVSINFLTEKFLLDVKDEFFDEILEQAIKIIKKIEPDAEII